VILSGALRSRPELPSVAATALPGAIICSACDAWVVRLLNQRGVVVALPRDPVAAVPHDAEVELDFSAGVLTEVGSGRRYALEPLPAAYVKEIRSHG